MLKYPQMRSPRVLLLDLDNTLVHSEVAYDRAMAQISLSTEDGGYLHARSTVKSRLPKGHVCARNRLLYFKALLEQRNRYSPRAVLSMIESYEAALSAEFARQWKDLGRQELFARLARRGPIGLITNENLRTQLVKLRAIDPDAALFSIVVTSEEIGVEKPDPRIFAAALQAVGARPDECLMVGDSLVDDVRPCLALGMQAFLTREFIRDQETFEGRSLARLDELKELLAA